MIRRKTITAGVLILLLIGVIEGNSVAPATAQDAREQLGPGDAGDAPWARGPHPLEEIRRSVSAELRPELRGVHPRVYVTEEGLEELRRRARTTHREMWQRTLDELHPLHHDPPEAPAQERRVQNRVGIGIAEAALAYRIEEDPKYLEAARRYMDAAVSYDVWGYIYNKPDVDLAAGHLLYGLGWGYDLLYHELTEEERKTYRDKLSRQARILFDYYDIEQGRTYSYSQNHVFIPMAGLVVAAYALYDEVEDAPEWARLARTLYDRVLATYSNDGYYYEGFEYWVFATPWLFHFLDAQAHAAGEDLWERVPGFRSMHKYVAHSMLPDGQNVFDFGDTFEGALTRLQAGEDHLRTHPDGRFHTNFNLLFRLASRYQDPEIQSIAHWLREFDQVNMEDYWSLLWYDADLEATPMSQMRPYHYFSDHDVVFWRSDWSPNATAFAFKAGPPEGHKTTHLIRRYPDWHLSTGHAHPDAGSFIIYAGGRYLTGDTGWTGLPMTAHHNTVLFDDLGQAKEGEGHDVFHDVDYDRLNLIHIAESRLTPDEVFLVADVTTAYEPDVGVDRLTRTLHFRENRFEITDEIALSTARTPTRLLHADENLTCTANGCIIDHGTVSLTLESADRVEISVEPNDVVAPGDPGSVDQGERQQRGVRAAIRTTSPVRSAVLRKVLTLQGVQSDLTVSSSDISDR